MHLICKAELPHNGALLCICAVTSHWYFEWVMAGLFMPRESANHKNKGTLLLQKPSY